MAKIKGIWKFNDIISLINISQNVNFSCGDYSEQTEITIINIDGDNRIMVVPRYVNVYFAEGGWISEKHRIFDFGESEQEVADEFAIWLFQNANGGRIIFPESDVNTKVLIKENGITTLATANTYCETDIDLDVNIEDKSEEAYEAGKKAEYDRFWDAYQENGKRIGYQRAFAGVGWTDQTFKPKYDIVTGTHYEASSMFQGAHITDLPAILQACGVTLDISKAWYVDSVFQEAYSLTHIPMLDLTSATRFNYGFFLCMALHTVDCITANEACVWMETFRECNVLTNITFDGVIGQDIDFHWSPLSAASINSVITHLSDAATGKTATFKLSAVNAAFETAEGTADGSTSQAWLDLVAIKPNWTISLV